MDLFHHDMPQLGYFFRHPELEALLRQAAPQEVWDLGAGTGEADDLFRELGVGRVVAVEKEATLVAYLERRAHFRRRGGRKYQILAASFDELAEGKHPSAPDPSPGALAWVSWPVNRNLPGLNVLMASWPGPVMYVGCNDGFTACGHPRLFQVLSGRQILGTAELSGSRQQALLYAPLPPAGSPDSAYRSTIHPLEAEALRHWNSYDR